VQWYVDQVLGDAKPKLDRELFFTDPAVRATFKARAPPRPALRAARPWPRPPHKRVSWSLSGHVLGGQLQRRIRAHVVCTPLRLCCGHRTACPQAWEGLPAQGYISTILLRNNTLVPGGLLYKDDPTVLAWELQNEPQLREGYEKCAATAVPECLHPRRCRSSLTCCVLAHRPTARMCACSIAGPVFPYKAHVCRP
jgi:hypothetical protein